MTPPGVGILSAPDYSPENILREKKKFLSQIIFRRIIWRGQKNVTSPLLFPLNLGIKNQGTTLSTPEVVFLSPHRA